jgi:Protein of unknown function (DUF3105)
VAKKPRTPPPPRRVQAPKQRHDERRGLDPQRQRMILYGLAGSGLVGLAVVLVVIFAGGKSSPAGKPSAVAATMKAAGCTLVTAKSSPSNQHIGSLSQSVTYSSFPAVSGRHYSIPAVWGNYTQEVDPRQAVHNMEHGGVVIWVGPKVSEADRATVGDFYDSSPNAVLVTPIQDTAKNVKYPKHAPPGSKLYLTAWTIEIKGGKFVNSKNVTATCPRFDEKAFAAFRDEFRGKGPERFPVDRLVPGT